MDHGIFIGVSNSADGDVDGETWFAYRQDGGTIWAEYAGGAAGPRRASRRRCRPRRWS